jgi:hypothetical protein
MVLLPAAPAATAACKPQAVFDRSYTNEGSPVVSRYFEIMGYKYVQYYFTVQILSLVYYSFFLFFGGTSMPAVRSVIRSFDLFFFVRSFRFLRSF